LIEFKLETKAVLGTYLACYMNMENELKESKIKKKIHPWHIYYKSTIYVYLAYISILSRKLGMDCRTGIVEHFT